MHKVLMEEAWEEVLKNVLRLQIRLFLKKATTLFVDVVNI